MGVFPNGQANRGPNAGGIVGWVNVLDEGLRGDGQGADGTALTTLVNALPTAGATLVMPPGTYNLNSSPTIPSNVTLIICDGVTLTGAGALNTVSGTGAIVDLRSMSMYGTWIFFNGINTSSVVGGESTTAPAVASSGTIATAAVRTARVSPAAAVTGIILAAGTSAGQTITVINEAVAANSVTFAASGTSNVADGVSSVIAGLTARTFVWDSITSLWYPSK